MNFLHILMNIKPIQTENRIRYLDVARGVIILLVLYQHASAPLNEYVLQFHMPALFILSGCTEHILHKEKGFLVYAKAKCFRLVIPYFAFEILNLVILWMLQCIRGWVDIPFASAFVGILTCLSNEYSGLYGRLWFLPAMFFTSIFTYLIKKLCRGRHLWIAVACGLLFVMSYLSAEKLSVRLPFTVDIAFLGTAFFLMGHLFGDVIDFVFTNKKYWIDIVLLAIFAGIFALCNQAANPACYMYNNQYRDFPFMVVAATAGTGLVFASVKFLLLVLDKVSVLNNLVLWYSVNSLAVFPIHLIIKVLSNRMLRYVGLSHWSYLLAIMLVLTIPAVNFINAYLPFMLGEFRTKKQKQFRSLSQ